MKSLKLHLIVAAAAILAAVIGLYIMSTDVENMGRTDTEEVVFVLDSSKLQAQIDSIAAEMEADTVSIKPQQPILRIGGRENPDVFLQSLDISVEVTGNIASTRHTMVFKNNTDRVLEGELTIPLPDGVTVTHYALDVSGRMREAVPVEKARAAQVFEEIQQRRPVVDPGIIEKVEGNNYRTRVYPFPARGTRTITIGYEEELALERGLQYYRLPMAYTNKIDKFSVKATVWNSEFRPFVPGSENEFRFDRAGVNQVASFAREDYSPTRALFFAMPAPADRPQVTMQSAQGSFYFLASVAPNLTARRKQWGEDLAVIWDVSLSGSQRDLLREMELLEIIFAEKRDANVHLYYLNNELTRVADTSAANGVFRVTNGRWDALKRVLRSAPFDGGTDYSQIKLNDIRGNEILFFSDGISTLSDADFTGNAGNNVNRPIHAVVSSSNADYSVMRLISGKTKGKFVNLNALSPEQLKDELLNETPQFLGVSHGGAIRDAHPSIAGPVSGNFSIAGIADSAETELTLLFGYGAQVEKRIRVRLDAKSADTLGNTYRIWAQKKIAELDLNYEANRAELTELGTQFGIVTRNTSLIVLESVNDYDLFNIEPPASEPQLLAEYRSRRSYRTEQRRGSQRDLLNKAVESAGNIARWWGIEPPRPPIPPALSGSQTPRYPVPNAAAELTEEEVEAFLASIGLAGIQTGGSGGGFGGIGSLFGSSGFGGFGQMGFAADIDAIISGVGGLRSGGDGGVRRGGVSGIGYGSGFGGGGDGGMNFSGLLRDLEGRSSPGLLKKGGSPGTATAVGFQAGGALVGGRSRPSIQRVVVQNMPAIRHAYNRRLRDVPNLGGRVDVKFAITEFGTIAFAEIQRSTICDEELEKNILQIVRNYRFDRIDKPGDVTEVVYPFVFDGESERAPCARGTGSTAVAHAGERQQARTGAPPKPVPAIDSAAAARALARQRERERAAERQRAAERARIRAADSVARIAREKPYLKALTGTLADDYQTYLTLRTDHANSPIFYLDMADWFYTRGDRRTAMRILTSIADLELENAPLYRMLGYKLKEYGEYALQKFVCRKVVMWRPIEPQSYRDYALALADNGEDQAALDLLNFLITKSYSANIGLRSDGIEEAVIMEMNRLIAKNPRLNASRIDSRLIMNVPVDVRVVLNWNMNNVDLDLHVIDPNNEDAHYGNRSTRAGGRMSVGNRSGYGPEQFILKDARSGKYRVYANFYSAREFADAAPSTVMVEIYTKYAGGEEKRQVVNLQVANAIRAISRGRALAAEFERSTGRLGRALVAEFEI